MKKTSPRVCPRLVWFIKITLNDMPQPLYCSNLEKCYIFTEVCILPMECGLTNSHAITEVTQQWAWSVLR